MGAVELTGSSGSVLATTFLHGIGRGPAIGFDPGVQTTVGSELNSPYAVAVDAAGDVFVAEVANFQVVELPAGGGAQTTVSSGLNHPSAVAVDGAGDVFIADTSNNRVVEVPAGGAAQTTVGSGLLSPFGVAVDGAGDVFIADTYHSRVVEVPAGGGAQTTVGSGLSYPYGVAVDGAGDVFITETSNSQVVEVPAGGGAQITLGSGLNQPAGVAVDGAGDVFIADANNNRVVEVPAGGGAQTTVGSGVQFPTGVAVDGAGDIFIASYNQVVNLQRSLPPSLSFSSTQVGQTSSDSPQSFQIQNIGNQTLTAAQPGLVIGANFDQVPGDGTPEDCTSGFSLTPGQLCNLSISFEPQSAGSLTSTAVFTDNALNGNPATQTITLNGTATQASQTITFTLTNPVQALTSATLAADSSAGLPVTYTSSTPTVCSVSVDVAQFLTSGTCTIVATQTGNAAYSAALPVTQSTIVTLATQTITFTALGTQTAGTTATLSATSSSNGTITFGSTTPSVCTVSGTKANFLTGGICTLTASVPANNVYAAATTSQSFTVIQKTQTITFSALPGSDLQGTVLTLTATASSGLPVSFTSLTPTLCSISGSTATLLQAGTCTIQASQSGNATYAAAPSVSESVTVIAAFTITPTPSHETIYRGDVAAFLLELKAASGFTGKVTLSCSGGPSGSYCADFPMTVSFNKGIALAISGVFFPAKTTPGTYTLTFTGTSGSIVDTASATFIVEAKP
jgi:sugar lactone lactonase YvrE